NGVYRSGRLQDHFKTFQIISKFSASFVTSHPRPLAQLAPLLLCIPAALAGVRAFALSFNTSRPHTVQGYESLGKIGEDHITLFLGKDRNKQLNIDKNNFAPTIRSRGLFPIRRPSNRGPSPV